MTIIDNLNGIFSILIVSIFIIVGILTILNYRKVKNKIYITWGIALLGLGLPWMGTSTSFLFIIASGEGLSAPIYFFLALFLTTVTSFFWVWSMSDLLLKEKKKIILVIYGAIGISFDVYLVYYLLTDPSVIGTLNTPPLDSEYHGLTMIYILFSLFTITILLGAFIWKSFKLDDPEIKLKAVFLLLGIVSYFFGTLSDGLLHLDILTIVIVRLTLIISALEFYIGWNLPNFIKRLFLHG